MAEILYQPRNGCALHGALKTLEAMRGAVPIVHANAGCAVQNFLANRASGFGATEINGLTVPGTCLQERHVIFGGASRLREEIKNTVKVISGELYVVLGSCEAAMVGDDIEGMAKEAREQGFPVLAAVPAGFSGDSHAGYSILMENLVREVPKLFAEGGPASYDARKENENMAAHLPLSEEAESAPEAHLSPEAEGASAYIGHAPEAHLSPEAAKRAGEDTAAHLPPRQKPGRRVNLFGILPQQDIYYAGDIAEITRLLRGIGLSVNRFFGPEDGVAELRRAPDAVLSVSFSRWGDAPAKALAEEYGVPYLLLPSVPSGIAAVRAFLTAVAMRAGTDPAVLSAFLREEEENFDFYFESARHSFYEDNLARSVSVVGDEHTARQIAGFLREAFHAEIRSLIITDFYPEDPRAVRTKTEELRQLTESVFFTTDTREIAARLKADGAAFVVGSSLEAQGAKEAGAGLLAAAWPVYNILPLNRTYAGTHGALALAGDYIGLIRSTALARAAAEDELFARSVRPGGAAGFGVVRQVI